MQKYKLKFLIALMTHHLDKTIVELMLYKVCLNGNISLLRWNMLCVCACKRTEQHEINWIKLKHYTYKHNNVYFYRKWIRKRTHFDIYNKVFNRKLLLHFISKENLHIMKRENAIDVFCMRNSSVSSKTALNNANSPNHSV